MGMVLPLEWPAPESRRGRYTTPNYLHPNLRFWYTPDALEAANVADGASVTAWTNIANICYQGHWSSACTSLKQATSATMADEALLQTTTASAPVFKRSVLNGHGVVHFTRSSASGTAGQFLQMYTAAAGVTTGFQKNPFANSGGYTIFLVVRTIQSITDTGNFGILNLVTAASSLAGLSLYKRSVSCLSGAGYSGLGCTGTVCKACASASFTGFGTINAMFGSAPTTDDNSCLAQCAAGCDIASPPPRMHFWLGPRRFPGVARRR